MKGGYALELRFRTARATVDIDISVALTVDESRTSVIMHEMLRSAASIRLGDWFEYTAGPSMLDLEGPAYGGARFPVEARVDGRVFARFHLDAGIGDELLPPTDSLDCQNWLDFAGIASPRPTAGVKDLVDLALLVRSGGFELERAASAVRIAFRRRRTHEAPLQLLAPPLDWTRRFEALAAECALQTTMEETFEEAAAYYRSVTGSG